MSKSIFTGFVPGVVYTIAIGAGGAGAWPGLAMSETSSDRDTSPEGVTKRVDHVIQDAIEGRLTKPQRAAVRSAVDRAERVSPVSDSAIGRISQGTSGDIS